MNAHTKTETITEDGEVVTTSLSPVENKSMAVSLARAEIDMQITTAHAYPRSVDRSVKNIMSLATLDEETAKECIYALPRGGKPIRGPSVRLAEIIQSQWGNCRAGARVVHVDRIERYVEAEGVFHDLETNSATTARVRRRISDKHGQVFNEDMIVVTGNAACAIAKRNSILGGIPKAAWRKAYDAVEKVIAGDVRTLTERREAAMKAFGMFGVTPDMVLAALGVVGMDDVTLEHMPTLLGMHASLKSGEATVEEMFPKTAQAGPPAKNLGEKLDAIAGKKNGNGNGAASSGSASTTGGVPQDASPRGAPPAEHPSQQSDSARAAADGPAASDQPSTHGAGTDSEAAEAPEWPKGQEPKTEAEYAQYARAWFHKVKTGAIKPADATTQWKADMKLRNACGLVEENRDVLKSELDAIVADIKKAG